MQKLLLTMLITGLGILASRGMAQADMETTQPFTLHQCIETALANQADVLVGNYSVTAANARTTQAKSAYLPQVSVQTSTDLVQSDDRDNKDGLETSLSLTHTFYDGGLRDARVANAKFSAVQSKASLDRTKQSVIYSVTQAYFSLLRAKGLADVADHRVLYIQGQQEMVRARVAAGDAAAVDILPIDAQLANAQVDQLAAKNTVRTAAVQLQQAMGLTPSGVFDIEEVSAPTEIATPTYDDCLAKAITQRPEMRQSTAGIGVAKSSVKTAKINLGPRPVVTGQFDQPIGSDTDRTYSISAGIAFDLYTGNNTQAVYQEAKANLSSAEIRAQQTPKDITADVQTAYLNLTDAEERLKASKISLDAAQKNFAAQDERYRQGLAIPLDLVNAQLNVTTAQNTAVQAQYDYLTALAQLHYAMGNTGEMTWAN